MSGKRAATKWMDHQPGETIFRAMRSSNIAKGATRSGTQTVPSSTLAPLQIGSIVRGPLVNFGRAQLPKAKGGMSGLRIQGSQRWMEVGTTTTGIDALKMPSGSWSYSAFFDPNDSVYMSEPLHTLSDLFVRWKLIDLTLRYCPRVATTNGSSFALAWVDDPGITLTTIDTFNELASVQDSLVFPAYQPWSKKVPVVADALLFTDDTNATAADTRFAIPGRINCVSDAKTGSDVITGSLYIDYTIEFYEMMNLAGTSLCRSCGSSNVTTKRQLVKDIRRSRQDRERKELGSVFERYRAECKSIEKDVRSDATLPGVELKTLPSGTGTTRPTDAGGSDRLQPLGGPAVLVRSEPVTPSPSPSAEKAASVVPRSLTRSSLW